MLRKRLAVILICSSSLMQQATAVEPPSPIQLVEEGLVVMIDKNSGAKLHINQVQYNPPKKDSFTVTISSPDLKITPSKCNFSSKSKWCTLTVKNRNKKTPSYGLNSIRITNTATRNEYTKSFLVKPSDSPNPIAWNANSEINQNGIFIIQNGNDSKRTYQLVGAESFNGQVVPDQAPKFTLEAKSICYLDYSLFPATYNQNTNPLVFRLSKVGMPGSYISDVTGSPLVEPLYNGIMTNVKGNITLCSAQGFSFCPASLWGSWTVGLMNISSGNLFLGEDIALKPEQEDVISNWSGGSTNYLAYSLDWTQQKMALIAVEGSSNGFIFDSYRLLLPENQVVSSKPCSSFVN